METTPRGLGPLQTDLVAGSTHVASDLNMLRRAIKEGWPIDQHKRPAIVDRLLDITNKTGSTVMTKEGPVTLDAVADSNAISAARVLVAMAGQNQADRHHDADHALDATRLALDATQALASLTLAEKRKYIEQAGLGHLLPAQPSTDQTSADQTGVVVPPKTGPIQPPQ